MTVTIVDKDQIKVSMRNNLSGDEITILQIHYGDMFYYPKKELAIEFMQDYKLSEPCLKDVLFKLIVETL